MKPKAINILKIALLLLAALPVLSVFILQFHQKTIQHRMKEQLEKRFLQTVVISSDKVHWVKSGKELWLNNRLFDVKGYEQKNGTCTFTGLYDEEETMLVQQLQKNQDRDNSSDNKLLTQLFQIMQAVISNQQEEDMVAVHALPRQFNDHTYPLLFQYISIHTPPPRV